MADLLTLFVGFVLTTVGGGILGWYLQKRSWEQQNEARLREDELRRAGDLCQSISELLDKRRYRMLRLIWTLQEFGRGEDNAERVDQRRREYDAVLYEYNDRLNVNLSLTGVYFGDQARSWLDRDIYETFAAAGRALARATKATMSGNAPAASDMHEAARHLDALNHSLYRLNVYMMARLRDGMVGRHADDATKPGHLTTTVTA